MFKFLKEKLKAAVEKISKVIEEEAPEETKELKQEPLESKGESKKEEKKSKKKKQLSEQKESFEAALKIKEEFKTEIKEEKKSFFKRVSEKITTKKISKELFEEIFEDLEITLMENNVAMEVIEKIKHDLKESLVNKEIKRSQIEETITQTLEKSIEEIFAQASLDLFKVIEKKKPYIICFLGTNGAGKTTTIAKLTHMLKEKKKSVVLAAADTFRAAAIQQLKEWGETLQVKVIAHDYGSDPAAVAFDAIKYAEAHHIDIELIDTAGRLHSNKDLVREMEKIVRVSKPDLKIFVGEAITGNDCVEQASIFNSAIGIDGIILAKQDIDEKGGASVSISYITKKPIIYLGVGQRLQDLIKFDKEKIIKGLGL